MDEYIERLKAEGVIDSMAVATMAGATTEQDLRSPSIAPTVGDAEIKVELKRVNKHLKQLIDLKWQANLIAAGSNFCIIALAFVYLLIISR